MTDYQTERGRPILLVVICECLVDHVVLPQRSAKEVKLKRGNNCEMGKFQDEQLTENEKEHGKNGGERCEGQPCLTRNEFHSTVSRQEKYLFVISKIFLRLTLNPVLRVMSVNS